MLVEKNVPLQAHNTFHIVAKALSLVRIDSVATLNQVILDPELAPLPKFILGGGSNIVLTGDVKPLVLKVELMGRRLVAETAKSFIVEAGAGENWHDFVAWTVAQGYPGLENLALIPGTVGATPVQNIGAYGVELQDRFESLEAMDLVTGEVFTLNALQCAFGYRDSIFKRPAIGGDPFTRGANTAPATMSASKADKAKNANEADKAGVAGLAGRAMILNVRFNLPKAWKPVLGYADIDKKLAAHQTQSPATPLTAQQIFDWVCEIRRAKLPDPQVIGNVGSFFKNPTVTTEQCADIIAREPRIVHYHLADGSVKLAAGWLIDACGWRGKSVGQAGVYEKQALVLVNRGAIGSPDGATGGEVMTLAKAIQTSVYERFGIRLEAEPVVV